MAVLDISNVSKAFSTTRAVESFDLTVGDGELVCLLGPSGSGKSTLLRMVGGFETPTSGVITIDGEDVTRIPPEKRPTGMVFQSHALWTHMNVFRNLAFGLKLRRLPQGEIDRRVEAALDQVGLAGYGQRMTDQLSGGQQQRVALARSLVLEPKILLLDEPFASLDQHLRERLREEVRDIQQRLRITTLFVTHGQDEALALADRIVVMRDGRTEQIAPPDVVYREPATPFVAGFIGTMNLIEGTVRGRQLSPLRLRPAGSGRRRPGDARGQARGAGDRGCAGRGRGHRAPGHRLRHPCRRRHRARGRAAAEVDGRRRAGLEAGLAVELRPRAFAVYRDNAAIHRSG